MNYIAQEFTEREWKHIKNTRNEHIFEKNDYEFAITHLNSKIFVSAPLANSNYNFQTSFNNTEDFNEVHTYILNKLNYFEN